MKLRKKLEANNPPHWFHAHSTRTLIWKSSASLLPLVATLTVFDWKNTLGNFFGSLVFGFGLEYVFRMLAESRPLYKDGDLFLICAILTPLLPTPTNLPIILNTVFFACVIARFSFGGRGKAVFYSIPIGILGAGLFFPDFHTNSLLITHSNWFVFVAMGLGAAVMLKSKLANLRMAVLFFVTGSLIVSVLNPKDLLFKLIVLFYAAVWIFPDSPKPTSKPAQIWFSVVVALLTGLFNMKLNFTYSILLSLLCMNCFAFGMDDFFATKRLKVPT